MAGADTSGPSLKRLAWRRELIQQQEVMEQKKSVKKVEDWLSKNEQVFKKPDKPIKPISSYNTPEGAGAGRRADSGAGRDSGRAGGSAEGEGQSDNDARRRTEEGRGAAAGGPPEGVHGRSAAGSSRPPRQPPPPGPAPHIHNLPGKVLEKIFALLSLKTIAKVRLVCRLWRDVIEDGDLIKKLKFEKGKVTTQEALGLIHSAQGQKSLELVERSDAVGLLDAVSARCTNLLHLSVHSCKDSVPLTEALRKVFHTNPHITAVRLRYTSTSKSLRFYRELGAVLPDLRKLEFHIDRLSSLQLHTVIDSCSHNQMEEFKAPCTPCSEETIAKLVKFWGRSLRVLELNAWKLADGALARLVGCSELRRLKLYLLSAPGDWLCDVAALSHLEELYVAFTREVEPLKLFRFFSDSKSSHQLRKLSLHGWCGVDNLVLASVEIYCPQLEELEVTGLNVTISGVKGVLRGCRSLHKLTVDDVRPSVAWIVPELPQLAPQLRRIRIGNDTKRRLSEDTLRRVQAQMPHLRIE